MFPGCLSLLKETEKRVPSEKTHEDREWTCNYLKAQKNTNGTGTERMLFMRTTMSKLKTSQ
jgi:hypothetical protein